MRASLLHPLREPRHARRHRRGRDVRADAPVAPEPISQPAPQPGDPAAQRVREAGGPVDRASYACPCGYLFRASVSTSVVCPHCGADQAW
jgi:hypothetical protein